MHSIRYTVRAEIDLEEMIDYIARESFANAIKYLERYEARLDLLMRNPQIGTRCENKNIRRNCRVLTFESHLIVYREEDALEEIHILRIFHHRVDYAMQM